MNESIKPMCYGSTDLKDSLQAMLERETGTNYADLHKNGQRIQALGKARAKQEKVIASVRAGSPRPRARPKRRPPRSSSASRRSSRRW
jgi:hypothetical protein